MLLTVWPERRPQFKSQSQVAHQPTRGRGWAALVHMDWLRADHRAPLATQGGETRPQQGPHRHRHPEPLSDGDDDDDDDDDDVTSSTS